MIVKVISGGQTGADQAGLRAAKALGIATGGWVPLGCKTDEGPAPWLVTEFGCQEHSSSQYAPRTVANVRMADGTIWCGNDGSPGGRLTLSVLRSDERQFIRIHEDDSDPVAAVRIWLALVQPKILNIAGNRERTNPGIGAFVEDLLHAALK